jgi:hypothetical protein
MRFVYGKGLPENLSLVESLRLTQRMALIIAVV